MTVRQNLVDRLFFGRDPLEDFPAGVMATDLQGWQSQHKYLTEAIDITAPKVIVEIGVWKGASVATMAKALKARGADAVIIAIDTWLGSSEHYLEQRFAESLDFEHGYPRLYRRFAANICNEGLRDYVLPLPLDSLNAFEVLNTRQISPDVIHIDAGHDYASVMADLKAWWPLLRPGGVLIGDDYHAERFGKDKGKWPGVRQAFDEYFAAHPHTEFKSGKGKCLVRKPAT